MDFINKKVGKDIYKMVDDYAATVVLLCKGEKEYQEVPLFNKDLLMYLDSIKSPCLTYITENIYPGNVGHFDYRENIYFYTLEQDNFRDKNNIYNGVVYYNCNSGAVLYNTRTKYCIELCLDEILNGADNLHYVHSDIVDFYQMFPGAKQTSVPLYYWDHYLKYIPNSKKIIKYKQDSRWTENEDMFIVTDYNVKIETFYGRRE